MSEVTNAVSTNRTVADPIPAYESIRPLWNKSRAICKGERFVKAHDSLIDVNTFSNILIPFSPSMTQQQYQFYKAEAELPGIVSSYAKTVIGGLLRKQPQLTLPDGTPPEVSDWIINHFGQDEAPLSAFLDKALWEEMQTSRAWVYVDYPRVPDASNMVTEDFRALKPYPVLWTAEMVINWSVMTTPQGTQKLNRVIVRNYREKYSEKNEFHPEMVDTVWVHEIVNGLYRIRVFEAEQPETAVGMVNGQPVQQYQSGGTSKFKEVEVLENILVNGERLNFIPAWPLNGSIPVIEPILTPFIDREVSLYNKVSRRNHLLYGASTYTPVISSDMSDEDFTEIVNQGLGSWIKLRQSDTATVLNTPTEALRDMEAAIASTITDMAKMGIRMLTPETDQSGIALEIRNAAQTAQLGTLNTKVSNTMRDIILFMINWRYDQELTTNEVNFTLSADFNPSPLGSDWLRLATEWYQQGLIPRSVWLQILKQNDIIPPDYDDIAGQEEIAQDQVVVTPRENMEYESALAAEELRLQEEAQKTANKTVGQNNVTAIKAKKA